MSEYNPVLCSVEEYAEKHGVPVDEMNEINDGVQAERYARVLKEANGLKVDKNMFVSQGNIISLHQNFLKEELMQRGYLKEKTVKAIENVAEVNSSINERSYRQLIHIKENLLPAEGCKQAVTEPLIIKYIKSSPDVIADHTLIPSGSRKIDVSVTLHGSVWDAIEKLSGGMRLKTAIIENAMYKALGGGND